MRLRAGITRHWRARMVEWVLASMLLGQSLQLLSARDLAGNRIYRVLVAMIGQLTIGRFALILSLVWLSSLVLNGTFVAFRRISPWLRACSALVAACYWMLWAVTLFQATGPVTSVSYINHGGLSFLAAMCFYFSAQEVAVADERAAACRRRTYQTHG